MRFRGVPTHIYKTAVRSLYLIYIAVLVLADLRDLHDTFTVSPFRLCPPMPTELFTTALRRRALTSSEPLSQPVVSPSSLYILYHTQSRLSTPFDIIFLFNLVTMMRVELTPPHYSHIDFARCSPIKLHRVVIVPKHHLYTASGNGYPRTFGR